ncbi:hypothetical protein NDU88_007852 [Pleurodeles waltl]|uniref:Uncharacterized protein n=1 Tax=Pleurodeles waltl TaxID=8319 RepID=A0AAV7QLU2_PLEWA|nr:hypothetical protein NDU88_007852 [Pleurodeles waltl]
MEDQIVAVEDDMDTLKEQNATRDGQLTDVMCFLFSCPPRGGVLLGDLSGSPATQCRFSRCPRRLWVPWVRGAASRTSHRAPPVRVILFRAGHLPVQALPPSRAAARFCPPRWETDGQDRLGSPGRTRPPAGGLQPHPRPQLLAAGKAADPLRRRRTKLALPRDPGLGRGLGRAQAPSPDQPPTPSLNSPGGGTLLSKS